MGMNRHDFQAFMTQVNPGTKSDKYSVGLHRYMKRIHHKFKDFGCEFGFYQSEMDKSYGNLFSFFCGIVVDGDFIGARLRSVLCEERPEIYSFGGIKLIDATDDLVKIYLETGRCAFDKKHGLSFVDNSNRYSEIDEKTKKCNWCGTILHKSILTEVKTTLITRWTDVPLEDETKYI